ncbi:uncharacterized protein BDV17DRAFT_291232 [Aspergillus undulatus]|uniref:uncharacterized protein n=1 Tax=Aspergillus undulatus TaxID=1810928 RepID=UPI003CCD87BB
MSRSERGNSDSSSSQSSTYTPPKQKQPSSSSSTSAQTFPLAHPPPGSTTHKTQCLRFSTRLCLQIQQLQSSSRSGATRAIPILELYQPSTFGKSVVLPNSNGETRTRKVHGRDLYLTQSEEFAHLRKRSKKVGFTGNGVSNTKPRSGSGVSASATSGSGSGDESEWRAKFRPRRKSKNAAPTPTSNDSVDKEEEEAEDDVVAIIHTCPKPRAKDKDSSTPDAELFFPLSGRTFNATSPSPGTYQFQAQSTSNSDARVVFTWEKRPPSRSSPSTEKDSGDRFVLGVSLDSSETTTSSNMKRPWLAQLTRRGVHVCGLEGWADCRALIDQGNGSPQGGGGGGQGAGLYTLILSMAVWVARGEEWVV